MSEGKAVEASKGETSESFVVRVKALDGASYDVAVHKKMSVVELKAVLGELTQQPADSMRLIFQGKVLTPDKTVADFPLEEGSVLHLVRRPLMPEAATPSPAPPPISPAPAPSPPPLYARTRQFVNQMEQDLHISRPQEPAMSDAEPERLLNSLVDRTGAIASRVGDYLSPLVARGHARTIQRLGLLLTSLAADLSPELANQTVTVQIHAHGMPGSGQSTSVGGVGGQTRPLNLGGLFGQVLQTMQTPPQQGNQQPSQGGATASSGLPPDLNSLLGSVSSMISSMNFNAPQSATAATSSGAPSTNAPSESPAAMNLGALMGQMMRGLQQSQTAPQSPLNAYGQPQNATHSNANDIINDSQEKGDGGNENEGDGEQDMDDLLNDVLDDLSEPEAQIDRHSSSLPPLWRETIVRDMQLQRSMTPQRPLSDAYLLGSPNDGERAPKRRRIDLGAQDSLQRRLESALEMTKVSSVDGTSLGDVASHVSASLAPSFAEELRRGVRGVLGDHPDYARFSQRLPNATRVFGTPDEVKQEAKATTGSRGELRTEDEEPKKMPRSSGDYANDEEFFDAMEIEVETPNSIRYDRSGRMAGEEKDTDEMKVRDEDDEDDDLLASALEDIA